jgi:hypothetical protein
MLKMFVIYDSKIEAYLPPMFFKATGEALREFSDAVNKVDTPFHKHAPDFTLFEVGEYDDKTCSLKLYDAKINRGLALDFRS